MTDTDREREADWILLMLGEGSAAPVMELLERQFGLLANRAQVLLGLCGIVVTTTGFSGRLIAGTSTAAQVLIITGVAMTLVAAAVVVWGVLHLRWLSQQPGDMVRPWLIHCLAYRDYKTRCYRVGLVLMLIGMAIYAAAVALMLLDPMAGVVPMAR